MTKFTAMKDFEAFSQDKTIIDEDKAIVELYGNNYKTYKDSVTEIFYYQAPYYDYAYYYDESKGIIIEHSYYVGD